MSFCGLIKGMYPISCILCVRVKINKRSFEPFCVWIATDGEPETAVSASLHKIESIKNQHKHFFPIKSQTCDSSVNHFDGHFAYLKTLDFKRKDYSIVVVLSMCFSDGAQIWNSLAFAFPLLPQLRVPPYGLFL